MRGKLVFLVCSWFLLFRSCLGRSAVKKNCLKVTWPNSLKGVYECAPIGNFKVPKYGRSNIGTVVYPRANQKACRNFTDFNMSFNTKPGGMPIFLLADRGDCYFMLKTRNAQNAGAAAILVADDIEEPLITMDIPEKQNAGIRIPSALISKDLGDKIKKELSKGKMVNVKLDYE